METVVTETKSVVLRQKMKSAFAKVVLAAKARGTAKEKAQQAFAAFADFNFVDGYDRHVESQDIIDDASLVALALTRLSPACSRVAITGLPYTVTVSDSRTAEVFRTALVMSTKQRASDHLVKIVVAAH